MSDSGRESKPENYHRGKDGEIKDQFLEFITQTPSQYDDMCRELAELALRYRRRCRAMEDRVTRLVESIGESDDY